MTGSQAKEADEYQRYQGKSEGFHGLVQRSGSGTPRCPIGSRDAIPSLPTAGLFVAKHDGFITVPSPAEPIKALFPCGAQMSRCTHEQRSPEIGTFHKLWLAIDLHAKEMGLLRIVNVAAGHNRDLIFREEIKVVLITIIARPLRVWFTCVHMMGGFDFHVLWQLTLLISDPTPPIFDYKPER